MAGWSTASTRARNPERLAQATLYLPTRRAGRMAREIFLDVLGDRCRACCRASSRSAISTRTNSNSRRPPRHLADRPRSTFRPDLDELERRLTLAQLVAAWAKQIRPDVRVHAPLVVGGPASTLALADDLARLMDDMVTRGVDWNALDGLVPDALDQYWQLTLEFLNIAKQMSGPLIWPRSRQDRTGGAARPADRGRSRAAERNITTAR